MLRNNIQNINPKIAANGFLKKQYSLSDYKFDKVLVTPETPLTSHTVEVWKHKKHPSKKVVVKTVKRGLEHSLVADLIGQRLFCLLGLPVPKMSLIKFKNKYHLVEEFLEGYKCPKDPLKLSRDQENNKILQSGILLDILLNHYDRQPYNLMFKGSQVMFIDFGGSLTSSPSGKITGFCDEIDDYEIYKNIKAFQANINVNQAYGKVLSIAGKNKFKIINKKLVKELAKKLSEITDQQIDAIVEAAALPCQRRNKKRIEKTIKNMKEDLKIPIEKLHYKHYHYNFKEAKQTFTRIRDEFDFDESAYLKYAIKKRRDDLVVRFSEGQVSSDPKKANQKRGKLYGFVYEDIVKFNVLYFQKEIKKMEREVKKTNPRKRNIELAKEVFNLLYALDDMIFFGYPAYTKELQKRVPQIKKLPSYYQRFIAKIVFSDNQAHLQQIGENKYIIYKSKFYHRSWNGEFYAIVDDQLFFLNPKRGQRVKGKELLNILDRAWKKEASNKNSLEQVKQKFFECDQDRDIDLKFLFNYKDTTPPEYFSMTESWLKKLIPLLPLSKQEIKELLEENLKKYQHQNKKLKLSNETKNYLENFEENIEKTIKVFFYVSQYVLFLKKDSQRCVAILRDGLTYQETDLLFSLIRKETSDYEGILINRPMLGSKKISEYYWIQLVDILSRAAIFTGNKDYNKFYPDYYRRFKNLVKKSAALKEIVEKYWRYLNDEEITKQNKNKPLKVKFLDTGCHGSFLLFSKAVIDFYHNDHQDNKIEVDHLLYVTFPWFRQVFAGKYFSEYYPFMRDIEILYRSEHLYRYIPGSFESGKIKVKMSGFEEQLIANIELMVLANVCHYLSK